VRVCLCVSVSCVMCNVCVCAWVCAWVCEREHECVCVSKHMNLHVCVRCVRV